MDRVTSIIIALLGIIPRIIPLIKEIIDLFNNKPAQKALPDGESTGIRPRP